MTVRLFRSLVCIGLVATFLASCSSTHRLYLDSLRLAFRSGPEKSLADIQQSNIDLLQLELGNKNPVFLALAFKEDNTSKWVSADHAVFVFHHDKLVRTSGFPSDLLQTSNLSENHLAPALKPSSTSWQYTLDIANHEYGLPVNATLESSGSETMEFYGHTFHLQKWVETLQAKPSTPYWDSSYTWENIYLVEPESGYVIYSEQRASPFTDEMVITYVSRIARHLKAQEEQVHE